MEKFIDTVVPIICMLGSVATILLASFSTFIYITKKEELSDFAKNLKKVVFFNDINNLYFQAEAVCELIRSNQYYDGLIQLKEVLGALECNEMFKDEVFPEIKQLHCLDEGIKDLASFENNKKQLLYNLAKIKQRIKTIEYKNLRTNYE